MSGTNTMIRIGWVSTKENKVITIFVHAETKQLSLNEHYSNPYVESSDFESRLKDA